MEKFQPRKLVRLPHHSLSIRISLQSLRVRPLCRFTFCFHVDNLPEAMVKTYLPSVVGKETITVTKEEPVLLVQAILPVQLSFFCHCIVPTQQGSLTEESSQKVHRTGEFAEEMFCCGWMYRKQLDTTETMARGPKLVRCLPYDNRVGYQSMHAMSKMLHKKM